MTAKQIEVVEAHFRKRLENFGIALNPKRPSAKVLKMQTEFFAGAMSAQHAIEGEDSQGTVNFPPHWVMYIMSGRSILQ